MTKHNGGGLTAMVLAALITLAGCSTSGAEVGKLGGPVEPVTLTLGDANAGGATDGVRDFVADVAQLSHGAVRIVYRTAPDTAVAYETDILHDVAHGRWDLAWVGGRALDLAGDTPAAALQVPFLVNSYQVEGEVLAKLGPAITAGMSKAGVVGIGLIADHMRYPVDTKPITAPADFKGQRMRSYDSDSQYTAWQTVGAKPVRLSGNGGQATNLINEHKLDGLETDPVTWAVNGVQGTSMTVGDPLWPRTAAVFASPATWSTLPAGTRTLLKKAAVEANSQVLARAAAADNDAIRQMCRRGLSVYALDSTQIARFTRFANSITALLENSSAAVEVIRQIVAIKGSAPPQAAPAVPAGCVPQVSHAPSATSIRDTKIAAAIRAAFAAGHVYRSRADYNQLKAAIGVEQARNNAGTITWTFKSNSRFTLVQIPEYGKASGPPQVGTWSITGDLLRLNFGEPFPGYEYDTCALPTSTTVRCLWRSGNDGWATSLEMGGDTQPLTRIR